MFPGKPSSYLISLHLDARKNNMNLNFYVFRAIKYEGLMVTHIEHRKSLIWDSFIPLFSFSTHAVSSTVWIRIVNQVESSTCPNFHISLFVFYVPSCLYMLRSSSFLNWRAMWDETWNDQVTKFYLQCTVSHKKIILKFVKISSGKKTSSILQHH